MVCVEMTVSTCFVVSLVGTAGLGAAFFSTLGAGVVFLSGAAEFVAAGLASSAIGVKAGETDPLLHAEIIIAPSSTPQKRYEIFTVDYRVVAEPKTPLMMVSTSCETGAGAGEAPPSAAAPCPVSVILICSADSSTFTT